jgi:HipA-like kinase
MAAHPATLSTIVHSDVCTLHAVEHIRRMRGGSQSQLMRCSDGNYYVVKFQNNPQHRRVLVNEFLGTSLASLLGLPTAPTAIIEVRQDLIRFTPDLCIELPHSRIPCQSGPQFGSLYIGDPHHLSLADCSSEKNIFGASNLADFVGMLVFDLWTSNSDARQVIVRRPNVGVPHRIWMIDQGFCFNAGEWTFPDTPRRYMYLHKAVYEYVQGIESFEPWLDWLESTIGMRVLLKVAQDIPPEWYEYDSSALKSFLRELNSRRTVVRNLLCKMKEIIPAAFPNWRNLREQDICPSVQSQPLLKPLLLQVLNLEN